MVLCDEPSGVFFQLEQTNKNQAPPLLVGATHALVAKKQGHDSPNAELEPAAT